MTVIQYVLSRLFEIGITDIFGVPGDYSFPVCDAICADPRLRWIGCCNELNASYAADGYARIRGAGAVCTTYGVGELSALNGIAGAYAEHLPLFHLVGAPNMRAQATRAPMHHTLGNGEYNLFQQMTGPVVCAQAVMTPQNVIMETERLIYEALYHRRPVYMAFPADYAKEPIVGAPLPAIFPLSDPQSLRTVVDAIAHAIDIAPKACALPGILISRIQQKPAMTAFIESFDLPFATMFMDKSVLEEQHPNYIGMYDGRLMNEEVREFVESCDLIVQVGTLMTDFNSGAFTAKLDSAKIISIGHHHTKIGEKVYHSVEMADILSALAGWLPKQKGDPKKIEPSLSPALTGKEDDLITAASLFPRWADFLSANDILIAETGTCSMGMGFARLPAGATFHNQTLWGSIGWATPAAFGAAVASPGQRLVLITGDGAHQLTAQEISQFDKFGLKPIIFVVNNAGYLTERLLCEDPAIEYNDIPSWRYHQLPDALGCDNWYTARVETCSELDEAMEISSRGNRACYIEVVTDAYSAPQLANRLHEVFRDLYKA